MKICLNMIVKNESEVIQRCLRSVKSIIDYWVIIDTGSTDGTQQLILECMKEIPGELYERPWVDFAHNRNEALALARGKTEYLLFMDADEVLQIASPFDKTLLSHDFYKCRMIERGQTDVYRMTLVKDHPAWFWNGVLHEALYASETMSGMVLQALVKEGFTEDGNRTKDPQKFQKDAAILERALEKEPNNSRYVFYLAQSYGNAGEFARAIEWYRKRSKMDGHQEEVFWSLYCIGLLYQHIGEEPDRFLESYSEAYQYDSSRAEPLYQIACHFYRSNLPLLSYFLAKKAAAIPIPPCSMYLHEWIYNYANDFVLGHSAELTGRVEEAKRIYEALLVKELPADIREFVSAAKDRLP